MKAELSALIDILEEQKACQGTLVELSERKTKAISAGNTGSLSAIVEEEKAMLTQIKSVEIKQSRCIDRLAALLGMAPQDVRMPFIIERASGEQKESLARLRDELSALIDKQIKSNDINMRLLQMNMDYVQFLINTTSQQKTGPVYGNNGTLDKPTGGAKRLLDRKV